MGMGDTRLVLWKADPAPEEGRGGGTATNTIETHGWMRNGCGVIAASIRGLVLSRAKNDEIWHILSPERCK